VLGSRTDAALLGVLIFCGAALLGVSLNVLQRVAALMLAAGVAVTLTRSLAPRLGALGANAPRRVALMPVLLAVLAVGARGYGAATERLRAARLPAAADGAPNVLVLMLDTVRRDRFARPDGVSLTPALDRFTARGVWYPNAWSTTSWSLPSQASVLTGRYPHEHGADWPDLEIAPALPTLAEALAAKGYATGAFSGNGAWVTPEYLGRGFLRFEVYILEDILRRTTIGRASTPVLNALGLHPAGRGRHAPSVIEEFLEFERRYEGRPFFAYLCFMDANQALHARWFNHPAWEPAPTAREIVAAYDSAITRVGTQVAGLLDSLDRAGTLANTMVVITSDHGESFGIEVDDHAARSHGSSLYPEQTRVPLWVILPREGAGGGAVERAVSIRAIAPTIASRTGLDPMRFGGDPLPLLVVDSGDTRRDSTAVLATLHYADHDMRSVATRRWQYIEYPTDSPPRAELFDLERDPLARTNLVDVDPVSGQLRGSLESFFRQGGQAEDDQPMGGRQAGHPGPSPARPAPQRSAAAHPPAR
jgi:arylsulfatase A-like enzyme